MPGLDEEHSQHAAHIGNAIMQDHAVDKSLVLLLQPVEDIAIDEDDKEDWDEDDWEDKDFVSLTGKFINFVSL